MVENLGLPVPSGCVSGQDMLLSLLCLRCQRYRQFSLTKRLLLGLDRTFQLVFLCNVVRLPLDVGEDEVAVLGGAQCEGTRFLERLIAPRRARHGRTLGGRWGQHVPNLELFPPKRLREYELTWCQHCGKRD